MIDRPKVFVSYSHDSDEHRKRVLEFSEHLRRRGIDVRVDQDVKGSPGQGWPRWMLDQIDWADFVLVVCTATYYRRFRGHEDPGKGKGAGWEGTLITQSLYDSGSRTIKFVPVLFEPRDEAFVPEPLRGYSHYLVFTESHLQALTDFLLVADGTGPQCLGQPPIEVAQLGQPTKPSPLGSGQNLSLDCSPDIHLSAEQLRELKQLAKQLANRIATVAESLADPALQAQLAREFERRLNDLDRAYCGSGQNSYPIHVDYDQSIETAAASGNYETVAREVRCHKRPPEGRGKRDMNVHLFFASDESAPEIREASDLFKGDGIATASIEAMVGQLGRRFLDLHELLAFGARCPGFQQMFAMPALRTIVIGEDGEKLIPYLYGDDESRRVGAKLIQGHLADYRWRFRMWVFPTTTDHTLLDEG